MMSTDNLGCFVCGEGTLRRMVAFRTNITYPLCFKHEEEARSVCGTIWSDFFNGYCLDNAHLLFDIQRRYVATQSAPEDISSGPIFSGANMRNKGCWTPKDKQKPATNHTEETYRPSASTGYQQAIAARYTPPDDSMNSLFTQVAIQSALQSSHNESSSHSSYESSSSQPSSYSSCDSSSSYSDSGSCGGD